MAQVNLEIENEAVSVEAIVLKSRHGIFQAHLEDVSEIFTRSESKQEQRRRN